ncbi:hypothetical protein [Microvirga massiliensis]|uniref:hypothetical protein n=1 Tax=Microvirga massiliensis TaxID=1033741 RepID=UPI000B2AD780|nr:hypothetical protein [Microvirga massiliensis]
MKTSRSRLLLPGGNRHSRRHRDPPALNLILAITALAFLATGCLLLVAVIAG